MKASTNTSLGTPRLWFVLGCVLCSACTSPEGPDSGNGGAIGMIGDCMPIVPGETPVRVACIGDSITEGVGADPSQSYPSQLGGLLGDAYEVGNFGVSATTMLKNGSWAYWDHGKLSEAEAFVPNVVVIALGTNDMGSGSVDHFSEFTDDYVAMVELFQGLESVVANTICQAISADCE